MSEWMNGSRVVSLEEILKLNRGSSNFEFEPRVASTNQQPLRHSWLPSAHLMELSHYYLSSAAASSH